MRPNHIDDMRGDVNFDIEGEKNERIIKVLGVGGGGGNAVTSMHQEGSIKGVSFLLCNTDAQALGRSAIPHKIVLGKNLSGGLGAGNKPDVAQRAAEESAEEIRHALTNDGTKMVFITAGMGGGTGTGAAPIISRIAKEAGLLTVGIVTIPFKWEGKQKIFQALEGVNALRKVVDALLIVNNERLKEIFGKFPMSEAFKRADDTLCNAARGISDIINLTGYMNLDYRDVETTLENKGVAIISSGLGEGNQRLKQAFDQALNSPLLNNNNIRKSTHILLAIYSSPENELNTEELEIVEDFTSGINSDFKSKWGYYIDETLEPGQVRITILASGFDYETTHRSITGQLEAGQSTPLDYDSNNAKYDELTQQAAELYGEDITKGSNRQHKRPLLLKLSELDNEEILSIAEDCPAYNRDLRRIEEIRCRYNKTMSKNEPEDKPSTPEPHHNSQGVSDGFTETGKSDNAIVIDLSL